MPTVLHWTTSSFMATNRPDIAVPYAATVCTLSRLFPFHSQKDLATVSDYKGLCDYYLFDAKTSLYGGSGNQFDWNLLHRYSGMTPFLLSGGINPYSVKAIREFHHPKLAGIDINSRFEMAPGNKDVERIGKFLQAIRTGETAG